VVTEGDVLGPKLEKLVNTSGFPFQLRVQHEIERTERDHSWEVESREHPWVDDKRTPTKEHFLDLILQKGRMMLAVECKRTSTENASWVFLTDPTELPSEEVGRSQIRSRSFWYSRLPDDKYLHTWWDFDVRPSSVESEFCVVRGTGEDQSPLLERLARHLVDAAEEVGKAALTLSTSKDAIIVTPMIVTNAKLYACAADPANISLDEGRFTETPRFVPLRYVRFRKSLALGMTRTTQMIRRIEQADENRKRTVFVVNAEHLAEVLKTWRVEALDGWPHEELARLSSRAH
jgi:hypothetical protein